MGDSEGTVPPSKKRVAGRQITQLDSEPDENVPEPEMGTFQRASEEVLATRRILKVRRHQPSSAPSTNPFAGIRLVPLVESSASDKQDSEVHKNDAEEKQEETGIVKGIETPSLVNEQNGAEKFIKPEDAAGASPAKAADDQAKGDATEEANPWVEAGKVENGEKETESKPRGETVDSDKEKTENEAGEETNKKETKGLVGDETEDGKQVDDKESKAEPAVPFSSFQQLSSSQNAFTGLSGTGFSTSSFSFGSIAKDGPTFGTSPGSLFGPKSENLGIGSSNNVTTSSLPFGTTTTDTTKNVGPIETGEENEKVVFSADAVLYEYLDGGWKERGKGELKVNVSVSAAERSRLLMRARGNFRLILNANIFPDMSLASMDKRGITFACVNSAGEGNTLLTTFALKFRDAAIVEEFRGVVTAHKGKMAATVMKTPDNSPKASND